ncbi:4'-phosphopantetheinyl transferase superfamily protein [Catellatospora sp. KI3]|uniref:4'-phosphopantetheinyl transferase superfamily protein n=1 Tax=Catellatospora sp. KI3 TaxID=3041620 RepID=UPI0024829360|nr:4'-phosphopantetheinyl transferase superfamily protein [Catellatospora sp. KI3]MDI1463590.1 4'-phosphopantetheinyl transferase superfamily protein [Catellatospora sp. KI3]
MGVVVVWVVETELPAAALGRLESVLDRGERSRADALLLPADRRRYVVAHGVLRCVAAELTGVHAERIRWVRGPHGKPALADGPELNLSSSGRLAVVAVGGGRPVGVDVQRLSEQADPVRMADRYYSPEEAAHVAEADSPARYTRLWARKEACAKAAGDRLTPYLSLPVLEDVVPGRFALADVAVPGGYRAAVAVTGDSPFRTVVRRWAGATIPAVETVASELAAMLAEVTGEQAEITAATRLEQDLRLESVDAVELGERMRARWGDRVDLAAYYAELDIDQIIGLTVGDLARYVHARVGD